MVMNDMTSDVQDYDPNFTPIQSTANDAQRWGQGLKALPWVGAGLQAAGLAANIYGGYKSNQIAQQNYEAQLKEYARQRSMQEDEIKRQVAQQQLANTYQAANKTQTDHDRLLAQYAPYYRMVGI